MTIVVFDSGMGGLTVASALSRQWPDADLCYVADTEAFPYGAWDERKLIDRVCAVAGAVIGELDPRCFVVACNTASTVALDALRAGFATPFVGTVPAIKPAATLTRSAVIGVLATPATVAREYTQALVETYAYHCEVILHGCPGLAAMADAKMRGAAVDEDALRDEIAPVFVERNGRRTDVVVLGCTHYPLLLDEIERVAAWPVTFIDPADAIARRVAQIVGDRKPVSGNNTNEALVTSDDGLALAGAFLRFGFGSTRCFTP